MNRIVIINGPNLNFLGTREPTIYGSKTDQAIIKDLQQKFGNSYQIVYYQTNSEGKIIDYLQAAYKDQGCLGIIINPGAYSHTSIAILDCYAYKNKPVIEVHLSDYRQREKFRSHSLTAINASKEIFGLKSKGYEIAINELIKAEQ